MSADNGIYVLATVRTRKQKLGSYAWVKSEPHKVYRVAHVGAIDNFEYIKENEPYNLGAYMKDIWGSSKVFSSAEDALKYAADWSKEFDILEYGIRFIDTDLKFYGDL